MYTTNVREPVRADEKHLGRVKRHFIDTQVQTSSFELREISRYQVALKASRTGRGVPLFEDIPGLGVLFRPQPSQESSLQQNIILGQSTVYPTLFDLMGLRWAKHVVDTTDENLRTSEHVIRGRHKTVSDFVFEEASDRVDDFLGIKDSDDYKHLRRKDLYHDRSLPSPFHPNGYKGDAEKDPTGNDYINRDRRPREMQQDPPYDPRRRVPVYPENLQGSLQPIRNESGVKQAQHESSLVLSPTSKNADQPARLGTQSRGDAVKKPTMVRGVSSEKPAAAEDEKSPRKRTVSGWIKERFRRDNGTED
jgi:hypothetical protein